MTVTVYGTESLKKAVPNYDQLAADFKSYKEGLLVPDYFGLDGDYADNIRCKEEEVWHLHLAEANSEPLWSTAPQQGRPTYQYPSTQRPPEKRTSDKHLIYTRGYMDRDAYLLIAILSPDAHKQARQNNVMLPLADIAADFRSKV